MKTSTALTFTALAAATLVLASGPHTSASYTVQPAVLDGGGARTVSANYTNDGNVLEIAGSSASGFYTAAHGYFAQLNFAAPDSCPEFTAWQTAHFGSPANPLAAREADPDNDGVENFAEFAFNMNPNSAGVSPLAPGGSSGLPRYAVEEVEGRVRLTVEFISRAGCHDYKLEASSDLADWNGVNYMEAAPPAPLPGGMMRLKWADDQPFGGPARRFLRLRVRMQL
jgi:hypothetical protein